MSVTSITARFMRRVQVRQFEPMEAEITAIYDIEEGEDVPSAAALLIETKDAVMMGLRHKSTTHSDPAAAEKSLTENIAAEATKAEVAVEAPEVEVVDIEPVVREPGKPSPGKARRTSAEVAEDTTRMTKMAELADMMDPTEGTDELGPVDPAPAPAEVSVDDLGPDPDAAPVGPDLSDFDAPEAPEAPADAAPINDAELLKIATTGASALGADNVRTIIAGFGVKQLVQLDADQRATFRTQVTEAITAAKN